MTAKDKERIRKNLLYRTGRTTDLLQKSTKKNGYTKSGCPGR